MLNPLNQQTFGSARSHDSTNQSASPYQLPSSNHITRSSSHDGQISQYCERLNRIESAPHYNSQLTPGQRPFNESIMLESPSLPIDLTTITPVSQPLAEIPARLTTGAARSLIFNTPCETNDPLPVYSADSFMESCELIRPPTLRVNYSLKSVLRELKNANTTNEIFNLQKMLSQSGSVHIVSQENLLLCENACLQITIPAVTEQLHNANEHLIRAGITNLAPQLVDIDLLAGGLYLVHSQLPNAHIPSNQSSSGISSQYPVIAANTIISANTMQVTIPVKALEDFATRLERACWFDALPSRALDQTTWLYDTNANCLSLAPITSFSDASLATNLEQIDLFKQDNGLTSTTQFVNIVSRDPATELISNFADTPFVFEGASFRTLEGFVQSIKINTNTTDPNAHTLRQKLQTESGLEAKNIAEKINKPIQSTLKQLFKKIDNNEPIVPTDKVFIYWHNRSAEYGSNDHHQLIAQALQAKFQQNPAAMDQLLSFQDSEFVHNTGKPESRTTSLPARIFTQILTSIRDEALSKAFTSIN